MRPHWSEQYVSIVTGGDITKRDYVRDCVPLGVLYSWLHSALHQNGVQCITPAEVNRRLVSADAALAAARRR